MTTGSDRSGRHVFWIMALFVVLGVPFVAVLWESLNQILSLHFSARLWLALPATVILGGILYALASTLTRSGHL